MKKPYIHQCLSCGNPIPDPENEEKVEGFKNPVRYRHKTYEGCRKALAKLPPKGAKGHVTNLPGLDDMEKWD